MAWLTEAPVRVRRAVMAVLVLVTVVMVSGCLTIVLAGNGFGPADLGMVMLLSGTAIVVAVSFWSSLVGALLTRAGALPAPLELSTDKAPISARVAVLMPIRDEVPEDVFARLRAMQAELDRERDARAFEYFVLSDTCEPGLAKREEQLVDAWRQADRAPERIHYRRRTLNRGFKAGNVFDFCRTHGRRFDLMVVLDADSLMSGDAIRRLVRTVEARPEIGILQPLIVGSPASSAFARIFQFGMRHGMRAYAAGCAWWQDDEGPYWGHNAVVRIRPFTELCRMPELAGQGPLSGPVLSHDQLEAVLMRAGGYEVRVLPIEDGSLEQNPPTLPDFAVRDLRWCQGNMQYLKLLDLPGLRPLGRLQLLLAAMLFLASPMWLGFLALGFAQAMTGGPGSFAAGIDPALGIGLFVLMMTMAFAPKLIGLTEALVSETRARAYGGRRRLLAGAAIELPFSMLLGPIMAVAHSVFIGGLIFGQRIRWRAQSRTMRQITLRHALSMFWPQTLLGTGVATVLASEAPHLLPWAAPVLAGLVLAVPFAWLSANARLGRWMAELGLCASPEEVGSWRTSQARSSLAEADATADPEGSASSPAGGPRVLVSQTAGSAGP